MTTWPCAALARAELAPRTTMRVGGRAEWLLEPANPTELTAAWCAARERGFVPRLLGGGANLIVADGLLAGVVIATDRMARVFRAGTEQAFRAGVAAAPPADEDEPRLVAWAGAGLPGLVRTARDLGWSGLEGLVGVPGQLGGGVAMNAGGRWGEMWDAVERVHLLTPAGELVERPRAACSPAYRDGRLAGAVVAGAVLLLAHDRPDAIRERMRGYLEEKSAAQPVTERSSGCIFANPDRELADGRSAGQLLEASGAKGLARGDAIVSPKHANFVVNRGRACAADVLALVDEMERLVLERTGIRLRREVKVWDAAPEAALARPTDPAREREGGTR